MPFPKRALFAVFALLSMAAPSWAESLNLRVASGQIADGGKTLSVTLAPQSGRDFATFTRMHVGERMAISFENNVLIAPTLRGAIFASSGQLSLPLGLPEEQVQRMRDQLQRGDLFLRVTAPAE